MGEIVTKGPLQPMVLWLCVILHDSFQQSIQLLEFQLLIPVNSSHSYINLENNYHVFLAVLISRYFYYTMNEFILLVMNCYSFLVTPGIRETFEK